MASDYLSDYLISNKEYINKEYSLEDIVYNSFYKESGKSKKIKYNDLYRDLEKWGLSRPTFTPDQTKAIEETAKKLGLDPALLTAGDQERVLSLSGIPNVQDTLATLGQVFGYSFSIGDFDTVSQFAQQPQALQRLAQHPNRDVIAAYFSGEPLREALALIGDTGDKRAEVFRATRSRDLIRKYFELIDSYSALSKADSLVIPQRDLDRAYTGLEKQLLLHLATSLGVSVSDVNSGWDFHYLAKLVPEKGRVQDKQKFLDVVVHGLTGDFRESILDPSSRYGPFNQRVLEEMAALGLDADRWYSYGDADQFILDPSNGTAEEFDFEKLKGDTIAAIIQAIGSKKQKIKGYLPNPPRVFTDLKESLGKFPLSIENIDDIKTILGVLRKYDIPERHSAYLRGLERRIGMKFASGEGGLIRIGLWGRNPGTDLFQGNYTHCCTAIGGNHRPAIGVMFDYLTDAGINLVEASCNGKTVSQAYLVAAKDKDGCPILVVDNVEVNSAYQRIPKLEEQIVRYLKQFAEDIGFRGVVIGTSFNDISTASFPFKRIQLDKIGGTLEGKEYYFDAWGANAQKAHPNGQADVKEIVPVPEFEGKSDVDSLLQGVA